MELNINKILEKAQQSIADKELQIWILQTQLDDEKMINSQLITENELLKSQIEKE